MVKHHLHKVGKYLLNIVFSIPVSILGLFWQNSFACTILTVHTSFLVCANHFRQWISCGYL